MSGVVCVHHPLGLVPLSWLSWGLALSRVSGPALPPAACCCVSVLHCQCYEQIQSPQLSERVKPAWSKAPLQSGPAGPCWDHQGREGWQRPQHQCNVYFVTKLRICSSDFSLGERMMPWLQRGTHPVWYITGDRTKATHTNTAQLLAAGLGPPASPTPGTRESGNCPVLPF